MDINDFFNGDRYWSDFYVFFHNLPASSKTKAKIAMDEEVAKSRLEGYSEEELREILKARSEGNSEVELNPEDYDISIEKLNQVIDAVNGLGLIVRGGLGGKVSQSDFKPTKRPKSIFEIMLENKLLELDKQDMEDLASDFGF